jgi:hypothetical protein
MQTVDRQAHTRDKFQKSQILIEPLYSPEGGFCLVQKMCDPI